MYKQVNKCVQTKEAGGRDKPGKFEWGRRGPKEGKGREGKGREGKGKEGRKEGRKARSKKGGRKDKRMRVSTGLCCANHAPPSVQTHPIPS